MGRTLSLLGGAGLGAGLMYLFDPQMGRRRRSLLRDRFTGLLHDAGDAVRVAGRDLGHRAEGLVAEGRSLVFGGPVSDGALRERVRARLGRLVSHPHAIDVTVHDGEVTLRGPVLADEVEDLLWGVRMVGGVRGVRNELEAHREPGNVSALQGGRCRGNGGTGMTPAERALFTAAGAGVTAWGLAKQAPTACFLGSLGLGLTLQGLTGLSFADVFGVGSRYAVRVNKNININAPRDRVFNFWTEVANFPRFMRNVREVRYLGNGRMHWTVAGPGGVPVEWDAVVTRLVPNHRIAWRSEPGSAVEQCGSVCFGLNRDGSTRVDVHLSYRPPAGALGHAIASLFGADPKSEMDEDLMRMKSVLETGRMPHDTAGRRQEVPEPAGT